MLITDRQSSVSLSFIQKAYSFSYDQKVHNFSSLDEVHEFFRDHTNLDSIKFTCDGRKHYAHFFDKEVEIYSTKKALRRTLSQEGGGAWVEEKGGKRRYFIDESGWLSTNFKEVEAKDCVEPTSIWQKVLGLGLGMLAVAPGVSELLRHAPISKEGAMGALALQQKSPLGGLLALSMMPSGVFAQPVGTEFQINSNTTNDQANPSLTALNNGGFLATWTSSQSGMLGDIYGQIYDENGLLEVSEFLINTYTIGDQSHPSSASLSGGGFVVVWGDSSQDGEGYGIYGQRYSANANPIGGEFQVNTHTALNQEQPSIAALTDGGFVVSWTSLDQDGDNYGIFAQVYDVNGLAVGGEFQVNTYTTGSQTLSNVAGLKNGGFVACWDSAFQDGDNGGIFGQLYDPSFAASRGEFQVNSYTVLGQDRPKISVLENGDFVTTWYGNGQDGDGYGIFAQRYASNGTGIGNEFQVNTYIISSQLYPVVAALRSGGFVIIWESNGQDGDLDGVFGQLFDVSANPIGSEFQVNAYASSNQDEPAVTGLSDGGFVVAWQSLGQDSDGYGIYGQRFTSNGRPIPIVSTEFQVNSFVQGPQSDPSVAGLAGGGFVTAWVGGNSGIDQDGDRSGIFARIAFWNESRWSPEFQVNFHTADIQSSPSVAALNNGQFEISWMSHEQDGDSYGVYKRRYASDGTPLSSDQLVNTYTTGPQMFPSSTSLVDGGSVVVWGRSYLSESSLYGQRFNSFGIPVGNEFSINTFNTGLQWEADVAGLTGGGFVVVWSSEAQFDGYSWDITGQRFDSNGNSTGSEFQVNTNIAGEQRAPKVTALSNGGFVAVWMSGYQDGDDSWGILGQRYSSNGTPAGGEFHVNTYTVRGQQDPSVAGLEGGGFVVTWKSDDSIDGGVTIYGQMYASDGSPVGGEFPIEDNAVSNVQFPDVSALADGGFVVAWASNDQDGDQDGIFAKVFDSSGIALAPNFLAQVSPTTSTMQTSESSSLTGLQTSSKELSNTAVSPSVQSAQTTDVGSNSNSLAESIASAGSRLTQGMSNSVTISSSQATSTPTPSVLSPSSPLTFADPTVSSNPSNLSPSSSPDSPVEESEVPSGGGFPAWAGAVIGAGIAACLGILGFLGYKKHKGKKEEEDPEKNPAKVTDPPPVRLEGFESTKSASTSPETSSSSSSEDQVDLGPHPLDELVQIIDGKTFVGPNQEYELLSTIDRETGKDIRRKTGFRVNFHGKKVGSGEIGAGAYGSVSIARTKSGEYVALKKVMNGPNNTEIQEAIDEAKIHYHLRDVPNIIPFYHAFLSDDDQVIYLASSLAGYGTGKDFSTNLQTLDDRDQKERIVIDAAKGLSRAVAGMHAKRIFHLDLKWDNVVFDKNGEAYVIDLGKAQVLPSGILKKPKDALPEFLPPEIYMQYRTQERKDAEAGKIDAWGLGTCLLNFVIGKNFFDKKGILNHGGKHFFYRGSDEEFAKDLHAEMNQAKMPEGLRDVVIGLLKFDPKERLSAKEAMKQLEKLESYTDNREGEKLREADFKMMKPVLV